MENREKKKARNNARNARRSRQRANKSEEIYFKKKELAHKQSVCVVCETFYINSDIPKEFGGFDPSNFTIVCEGDDVFLVCTSCHSGTCRGKDCGAILFNKMKYGRSVFCEECKLINCENCKMQPIPSHLKEKSVYCESCRIMCTY